MEKFSLYVPTLTSDYKCLFPVCVSLERVGVVMVVVTTLWVKSKDSTEPKTDSPLTILGFSCWLTSNKKKLLIGRVNWN